jgi:lipopolysaccharide biosynthesis glycosyltransferase
MYWFSGINNHNKDLYSSYIKMYKVAVITAKKTNPNIKPILIIDGEKDEHIEEVKKMGVEIVEHKLQFYDDLVNHYKGNTIAYGTFLRIDIPIICKKLNILDEYVLYTDNDVMFIDSVDNLLKFKPKHFICAGEFSPLTDYKGINAGVMWMNSKYMSETYNDFTKFILKNLNNFQVYDQDAYKQFYKDKIDLLDYRYNYKPYWGKTNDIKILHFHGPKPTFDENELINFPFKNLITPFFTTAESRITDITLERIVSFESL